MQSKQVQDSQIYLLIGHTGDGKSTTIQYLAGSTLRETTVQNLKHLEVASYPPNCDEQLKEVSTSPFNVSETRFIRSIKVKVGRKEIILCDTPGTKDSRGALIDASNQYGLMLAAKSCASMVPLVLISRNSVGERCVSIKETLLGIA